MRKTIAVLLVSFAGLACGQEKKINGDPEGSGTRKRLQSVNWNLKSQKEGRARKWTRRKSRSGRPFLRNNWLGSDGLWPGPCGSRAGNSAPARAGASHRTTTPVGAPYVTILSRTIGLASLT